MYCEAVTSPDVLATYTRLRQIQRALNSHLMKTLSKKAIEESAKHLGFFEGGCLVADAVSDLDLVMDSAIYDYASRSCKGVRASNAP